MGNYNSIEITRTSETTGNAGFFSTVSNAILEKDYKEKKEDYKKLAHLAVENKGVWVSQNNSKNLNCTNMIRHIQEHHPGFAKLKCQTSIWNANSTIKFKVK
jgi:hypothetical protein